MRGTAYYCTVEELQKRGRDDIPEQFRSNTHLIYSSPATLAFNSPGAEGFGVKRAGLGDPGFDHADRGTGMLWAEYIHDQFHATV